jgi:hypothetical protein
MTTATDYTAITYSPSSLVLFRPENAEAREHLEDNAQAGAVWIHGCIVVEPRYLQGLIEGLEGNGFSVEIV